MASVLGPAERDELRQVKEETKLVLEAFLKRSLNPNESLSLGHVGRGYLDPQKYSCRSKEVSGNSHFPAGSPLKDDCGHSRAKDSSLKRSPDLEGKQEVSRREWGSIHEKINQVEEKKHGFKTNIKRLLRRHRRDKDTKFRDSLEGALEDPGNNASKANSLKKQKHTSPLLACTLSTTSSVESVADTDEGTATLEDRNPGTGARKKASHWFKTLKKKMSKSERQDVQEGSESRLPCPNSLSLGVHASSAGSRKDARTPSTKIHDDEFYSNVAWKLDKLLQRRSQRLVNGVDLNSLETPDSEHALPVQDTVKNNNVLNEVSVNSKEDVIQRIVELLDQEAHGINKQIDNDPVLRKSLARMSYTSFSKMVEIFTHRASATVPLSCDTSPELTKIVITMELTRKVAGINSHTVQTVMGYSMQYIDMFVPWLQKNGGWENLVPLDDLSEYQID
ncbi:uncharacterized protein BCL2L12 [Latimeria chalumnae]|uniref:uncharacterized protein BCL2L12 n=1 Tax=Latimeria chalumnae TaxID=7897 RepID=UPI0003C1874F|nr:PREDICTED: bcl-2-like protein 12 [Latimeria chalumnae]|eukprot:XP_005991021.1 PREDICTED: bcl-2-like protein 12 [Latimeria chalumnae]